MTNENILLSVVICTRNRANYLTMALDGLAKQTSAPRNVEILIVDNGSVDGTAKLAAQWSDRLPNVRYIFEPKAGLSIARNTGLANAEGEYLAYLDDDAIPDSRWLRNIERELRSLKRGAGLIGGKVLPIWEATRPKWLSDELARFLSMIDLGNEQKQIDHENGFVGANMIIARAALEAVGGFSSRLGRSGNKLLSNEELMVHQKIVKKGFSSFYCPTIVVQHHAPADRLHRKWFLRRLYWQGRSDVALRRLTEKVSYQQACRGAMVSLAKAVSAATRSGVLWTRPEAQMDAIAQAAYQFGLLREYLLPAKVT